GRLRRHRHVHDDLRIALDAAREALEVERVLDDSFGDPKAREDAVARAAAVEEDDVARLLAAEDDPLAQHPLEDVLVADGRPEQPDAFLAELLLEPEVAHDRGHDRAPRQSASRAEPPGLQVQDEVTVEDAPPAVHEQAAVGVPVEGETEIASRLDDGAPQELGMQ